MSAESLVVIGIGDDGPAGLTSEARKHVSESRVLAGGRRHLDFFPDWSGEKILIDADIDAVIRRLQASYRRAKTVVLASGDPLFFGIGRALLQALPKEDLLFLPHVSSVQLAFARLKETWHDARVVSLHGRPMKGLLPELEARTAKIAVLTDAMNHPAAIAELLRQHGAAADYALWVCENLGGPDERIARYIPATVRQETFSPLNVVILLREPAAKPADSLPILGIPESQFAHRPGPRGLITQREIRLLSLCYLELGHDDVLWDIGAGSGSIAIEAARLSPTLRVHAVERDRESFGQLESNVSRLAAGRVLAIFGEAPEALAELPDPNAVFIGGSGGRLDAILETAVTRLRPGGRVVLNCITLENLTRGWQWCAEKALLPEITSVQLAHSRPLGRLHNLEPENPIFILRARKP